MNTGPGHTRFIAQDDGTIDCQKWNDPSWRTRFVASFDMTPDRLARRLEQAYRMGRQDQATIVRNAIMFGEN